LIRETEHSIAFLDRLKRKHSRYIRQAGYLYGVSVWASTFEYANQHKNELLAELRNHLYTEIVVLQHISYAERKPPSSEALDPEFVLGAPASEFQITGAHFLRISNIEKPGNATQAGFDDRGKSGGKIRLTRSIRCTYY